MRKTAGSSSPVTLGDSSLVANTSLTSLAGIPRLRLARLRALSGMTQENLASRIGIKQKNISKLEGRDDMLLSTLKNYLDSLGIEFEILVHANGKAVFLDFPSVPDNRKIVTSDAKPD